MRPIRSAVERAIGRFVHRLAGRFGARFAHPVVAMSCAALAVVVVAEYAISVMAHVHDVTTVPNIALTVTILAGLIGSVFRPGWFLWVALVSGEVLMLNTTMVTPLAVIISCAGFLAYLDTWSGVVATGMLLISSLFGFDSIEKRIMTTAMQNLMFYCFPLLIGLLLRMMRQRDRDAHLLRRQRDRADTACNLHDTISNDLAYLILRIDRAEAAGVPADESDYRRQLHDLRDAANRAMRHTHAVIDSLEDRESDPSPFRPIRQEPIRPASARSTPLPSRESTPTSAHSEASDESSAADAQRDELQSLIDDEEARLDTLGFTGDTLLGELPHPLDDGTMRLLIGLMTELYANIAKHADPREWYALSVGFDANGIHVSASDTAKTSGADDANNADNEGLGLRSGLDRYHNLIEEAGGMFAVRTETNGHWQLGAIIPNRSGEIFSN